MTLSPFSGGTRHGSKTLNPAGEVTFYDVLGASRQIAWEDANTLLMTTWSSVNYGCRIMEYETPINWRVGSLKRSSFGTRLVPSVTGDPDYLTAVKAGSDIFAIRRSGDGESGTYIEKYNTSGTAQQKLSIGSYNPSCIRLNTGKTQIFLQEDNVLREIPLSSSGNLSTAGSATDHTFSGFSQSSYFDFKTNGTELVFTTTLGGGEVRKYSCSAFSPGTSVLVDTYPYSSAGSSIAYAETDAVTTGGASAGSGTFKRVDIS